ncbi:hypothetical protein [Pseudomonas yamanorum]|uniref:hypothetical protein n=1 Tax=Pseudomonas yamanorum TaxID=515393 RepID=UPI003F74B7DF
MTIFSKKQQAALASRKLNREYVSKYGGGIFEFEAPEFDSLNDQGLIPAAASRRNLPVTFEAPTLDEDVGPDVVHRLELVMRDKGVTNWGPPLYTMRYGAPGGVSPGDLILRNIPPSRLNEGRYEIAYIFYEDDNPSLSDIAPLEVDLTAPYKFNLNDDEEHDIHPFAPLLPADLGSEIDEQYVDEHDEGLVCTFPNYVNYGRAEGDTITVYFSEYSSSQLATPIDTVPVEDSLEFVIPWDRIEVLEAGAYYLFYILTDLAGNKSRESVPRPVRLNLVGVPAPLQARVPLALLPADGLIDLQDAYELGGVTVEIPLYANVREELDVIDLTWGGESAGRFNVRDYVPFPLRLPVDTAIIFDAYGEGPGEVDTDIEYVVDRNGNEYPAPTLTIRVDLSGPGPDPTPDPENSRLNVVTVYGGDPDTENHLLPEDFGNAATVEIVLWEVPPPVPGITITGYWGSFAHPFDPTELNGEEGGDTVTLTVPWSIIKAVGNGTIPVFYTLSWDVNDNLQRSRPQNVVVEANVVVMEAPTFVKTATDLACRDLNPSNFSARVRVPGNTTYFEVDSVIRLEWQVYSDRGHTTPLGDPVSFSSPPLTPDMVSNGFLLVIQPYMSVIRPAGRNSVGIQYFATVNGVEESSEMGFTTTLLANRNTPPLYCEELPVLGEDEA